MNSYMNPASRITPPQSFPLGTLPLYFKQHTWGSMWGEHNGHNTALHLLGGIHVPVHQRLDHRLGDGCGANSDIAVWLEKNIWGWGFLGGQLGEHQTNLPSKVEQIRNSENTEEGRKIMGRGAFLGKKNLANRIINWPRHVAVPIV